MRKEEILTKEVPLLPEYMRRIQNIEAPIYQHFRRQVPQYGPND